MLTLRSTRIVCHKVCPVAYYPRLKLASGFTAVLEAERPGGN